MFLKRRNHIVLNMELMFGVDMVERGDMNEMTVGGNTFIRGA